MAFSDKTLLIQLDLVYLRHKYCSILFDIVQYYWTTHSQYVGQHISINIIIYDPGWLSWESTGLLSVRSQGRT